MADRRVLLRGEPGGQHVSVSFDIDEDEELDGEDWEDGWGEDEEEDGEDEGWDDEGDWDDWDEV